jgi:hypothetical protein
MRLRLTGTSQEIAAVLPVLAAVLDVQETSEFYPHRGASVLGRVYLDVAGVRAGAVRATATRTDDNQAGIDQRRGGALA